MSLVVSAFTMHFCLGFAVLVLVTGMRLQAAAAQASAATYQCDDLEQRLSLGEYFIIDRFPPQPHSSHVVPFQYGHNKHSYSMGGRVVAPTECTWAFKALGGCVLELKVREYARGDVDCRQQHLLLGDEHKETRVCGFSKPPRRLRSTGKELFLTHYARNGRYETVRSSIEGVVRCRKAPPAPPPICPPQIQVPLLQNVHSSCPEPNCKYSINYTVNGHDHTTSLTCTAQAGSHCTLWESLSYNFVPANASCRAPLPPIPP